MVATARASATGCKCPAVAGRRRRQAQRVRRPHRPRHPRLHLRQPATASSTPCGAARGSTPSATPRKKRKKEHELPEPYTAEQLAEIDAAYEAETRRGAEPRYFEDVEVGDRIDPKVKGPLTTTDIVVWHLGWGMQLTPPGDFRLAYLIRKKAPGLYPPNSLNVARHRAATALGAGTGPGARPADVLRLRRRCARPGCATSSPTGWATTAGSGSCECQHRRFNFIGDTTWLHGEVIDKDQVDGRNEVQLNVWCESQRGEVTTPATATVLLPTADDAVELPAPPAADVLGVLRNEVEKFDI